MASKRKSPNAPTEGGPRWGGTGYSPKVPAQSDTDVIREAFAILNDVRFGHAEARTRAKSKLRVALSTPPATDPTPLDTEPSSPSEPARDLGSKPPTTGDPTANALRNEIGKAREFLIETVNTEPPRGWWAARLKKAVLADSDLSDGAVSIALSRLLDTGRLDIRNGDEVFDPSTPNTTDGGEGDG